MFQPVEIAAQDLPDAVHRALRNAAGQLVREILAEVILRDLTGFQTNPAEAALDDIMLPGQGLLGSAGDLFRGEIEIQQIIRFDGVGGDPGHVEFVQVALDLFDSFFKQVGEHSRFQGILYLVHEESLVR